MEHASAEEIVDLQKKRSALNLFFVGLSSKNKDLNAPYGDNEDPSKRNAGDAVVVSYLSQFGLGLIPINPSISKVNFSNNMPLQR